MIKIGLDKTTRENLLSIRRKTDDSRSERALAVLLSAEGESPPNIAKQLKRHYNTVRDWLNRFQEHGIEGLQRNYSPGRPSRREEHLIPLIEECLMKLPSDYGYREAYWNTSLIRDLARKKTGEAFSTDSVERALHDAGFVYKRPREGTPVKAPSKKEKREKVLGIINEIREILRKEDITVYAADETHMSTEPYVIKGWYRKGEPFFPTNSFEPSRMHSVWCIRDGKRTFLLEERRER